MKKYVLLGRNINYSLSPKLHKIILDKIGIVGEYTLFNTANFLDEDKNSDNDLTLEMEKNLVKDTVDKIRKGELQGMNITQPYKELVISYLDMIDEVAKKIGAVNTVAVKDGKTIGYNTDYLGVIESIKKLEVDISGKKVYILGTGGASKGVAYAVECLEGVPILVSREKQGDNIINYEVLEELAINDELLINCTPKGIPEKLVIKFKNIFNINYAGENEFNNGIWKTKNVIDGMYMLGVQGVKAQELWQDKEIGGYNDIFEQLKIVKEKK